MEASRVFLKALAFLVSLGLCAATAPRLSVMTLDNRYQEQQALYLPKQQALEYVSLGYNHALAHLLWFKTISYFGKEYRSSRDYRLLGHMCDVVTYLNPHITQIYRFCATMLSWEVGEYHLSNRILSRAMEHFPKDWIFPYLRGFNFLYFLKDTSAAHNDFLLAAKLPDVHPVIASLAAKKSAELNSPEIARMTIKGLIQSSDDPIIREALEARLRELEERP